MVDSSHLPLMENISYTKYISVLAHSKGMLVEAELGRLSGTEDDLTVEDYEAKLTDASQVNKLNNFEFQFHQKSHKNYCISGSRIHRQDRN